MSRFVSKFVLCLVTLIGVSSAIGCQSNLNLPEAITLPSVEAAYEPQTVTDGFNNVVLRYRILKPATIEPGKKYPLVLVLHGIGESGDDNREQLKYGAKQLLAYTQNQPAFVVIPQCPRGTWWDGPSPLSDDAGAPKKEAPMPHIFALLTRLMREQPIDRSRIYITGMSMGGFGTFAMVAARPDLFAAAVPISGGGDPRKARFLRFTSFFVIHGEMDPIVSVDASRQIVDALRFAGTNVKYAELSGVGHDAWNQAYNSGEVLDWMFSQRRRF